MHSKLSTSFIIALFIVWASSCRKDFEYAPSNGHLTFSKDTVFLDTVFSTIGSSTYTLKVYNNTRDDVIIPSIQLRNGTDSYYRINVDGVAGKNFQNIPLYVQDSLFIFIETTVDLASSIENTLLYTDAIEFDSGDYLQQVELVTLVKDAIFLFPKTTSNGNKETIVLTYNDDGEEITTEGFELNDNELIFTNEKPYVIYGYALVPNNKKLIVDAGARVHFHKNSGILIKNGASLSINGEFSNDQELLEGEVIFEGDRLEPEFSNIPGQWGGIWIESGSANNTIDHLTIKNANIGIYVEGNDQLSENSLDIKNTQIYNSSNYNIWSKSAHITGQNTVLGGAGKSSLYCNLGGSYNFTHTTIANYWNGGYRTSAALRIDNFSNTESGNDLVSARFKNCIIDGNGAKEISLNTNGANLFNFSFENCIIKFNDTGNQTTNTPLYDFDNENFYIDVLLNGKTAFFSPLYNDFRIALDSDVVNLGNPNFAQEVPEDILKTDRTTRPDLGAYQAIENISSQ